MEILESGKNRYVIRCWKCDCLLGTGNLKWLKNKWQTMITQMLLSVRNVAKKLLFLGIIFMVMMADRRFVYMKGDEC